jgi:hypothetical protein
MATYLGDVRCPDESKPDTDTVWRRIQIVDGASGSAAMIAGHHVRIGDVVTGHERLGPLSDPS